MALGGYGLMRTDSPASVLGLAGLWFGGVLAIATAWRNSHPLARATTLRATGTSLELLGETIAAEDVVEAKLVRKPGAEGDTVLVLTVRGRGQRSLWMRGEEAAALVRQAPEFRMKTTVGRCHLQAIDIEIAVKNGMAKIEANEFPLGKSALQIVSQDFQLFRPVEVLACPEVVGHDETASPDVLAQVFDFLVGERQEAGL